MLASATSEPSYVSSFKEKYGMEFMPRYKGSCQKNRVLNIEEIYKDNTLTISDGLAIERKM